MLDDCILPNVHKGWKCPSDNLPWIFSRYGTVLLTDHLNVWFQHHGLFTERHDQSKSINAAERKILIVFVYEVIILLLILYGRILDVRDRERFLTEIHCYFQCESMGMDPENPCDTTNYMNIVTLVMTSISFILLGLFPLVNFLFVVNIQVLKQHLKRWLNLPCQQEWSKKEKDITSRSGSASPSQHAATTTGILWKWCLFDVYYINFIVCRSTHVHMYICSL